MQSRWNVQFFAELSSTSSPASLGKEWHSNSPSTWGGSKLETGEQCTLVQSIIPVMLFLGISSKETLVHIKDAYGDKNKIIHVQQHWNKGAQFIVNWQNTVETFSRGS